MEMSVMEMEDEYREVKRDGMYCSRAAAAC